MTISTTTHVMRQCIVNKYVSGFLNDAGFVNRIDALASRWFSKNKTHLGAVGLFEKEDLCQEAWAAMLESDIVETMAYAYVVAEDKIRRLCRKGRERQAIASESPILFSDISWNQEEVDNFLHQHGVKNRYDAPA